MSCDPSGVEIEAVIPAAGRGRRMGAAKQALPYRGATFAAAVVQTILDAGAAGATVVTRHALLRDLALPNDPRIKIAFNEDADSEMIESIRIGLTAIATRGGNHDDSQADQESQPHGQHAAPADVSPKTEGHDHVVRGLGIAVVPADMPALSVRACRLCFRAFASDPERIVLATCAQRRGHPIVLPYALRESLNVMEEGLNRLPELFPERVLLVETGDPAVVSDIDTPQDLDKLYAPEKRGGGKPDRG